MLANFSRLGGAEERSKGTGYLFMYREAGFRRRERPRENAETFLRRLQTMRNVIDTARYDTNLCVMFILRAERLQFEVISAIELSLFIVNIIKMSV